MKKSHTAVKQCAEIVVAAMVLLWVVHGASAFEERCKDFVSLYTLTAELAADTHPHEFTEPLYLVGYKDSSTGRQTTYDFTTRPPGSARHAITFTAQGMRNNRQFLDNSTFNGKRIGTVNVGLVSNLVVDQGQATYLKSPDLHVLHTPAIGGEPAAVLPLLDYWKTSESLPSPYSNFTRLNQGRGQVWIMTLGKTPASGVIPTINTVSAVALQMFADVQYGPNIEKLLYAATYGCEQP